MLVYQPWEKASMAAILPSCTSTGNRPSTHPCVIAAQHIMGWRPPDLAYARHEHWRHAVEGTAYCVFDLCSSLGSHRVPHVAPSMDGDRRNSNASTLLHLFFSTSSGAQFSSVQTFKIKGLWKNNNGCTNARFHSPLTLSFILQRNANVRLSGISTAANATSASAEFLLQRTPTSDSACTSVSFDGCFRARRQPRTPTSCTMAKNFVDMCDNFKLTRTTTTTTTTTTPALFTPSPATVIN